MIHGIAETANHIEAGKATEGESGGMAGHGIGSFFKESRA